MRDTKKYQKRFLKLIIVLFTLLVISGIIRILQMNGNIVINGSWPSWVLISLSFVLLIIIIIKIVESIATDKYGCNDNKR